MGKDGKGSVECIPKREVGEGDGEVKIYILIKLFSESEPAEGRREVSRYLVEIIAKS